VATWHKIRSYRGIYDWTASTGHILMHTEAGNFETTALKAEEFLALLDLLRNSDPMFTDGLSRIATGEEPIGTQKR